MTTRNDNDDDVDVDDRRTQQCRLTTIMTSTVCINGRENANVFVSFITHFSYLVLPGSAPLFSFLSSLLLFLSQFGFSILTFFVWWCNNLLATSLPSEASNGMDSS